MLALESYIPFVPVKKKDREFQVTYIDVGKLQITKQCL